MRATWAITQYTSVLSQKFAAENSSVRRHALLLGIAVVPATVNAECLAWRRTELFSDRLRCILIIAQIAFPLFGFIRRTSDSGH
jgi:hypothetical protein